MPEHGNPEFADFLFGQSQTHQATPVGSHEVDTIRCGQISRQTQVGFPFPSVVFNQDHHFSLAELLERFFYG